jgi:hypothetical protein
VLAPALLLALTCAAACTRKPPPPPVHNVVTVAPPIAIAPDAPLGWLALGTVRAADSGSWLPASALVGAITLTDDALPARVTVIPASGPAELLTPGEAFPLPYGCDNNQLGVRPLSGPRIAPGPAWILPPSSSWRPTPLAITRTRSDPTRRAHAAGPLAFDLVRRGNARAALVITRESAPVFESVFERGEMDGAPTSPIDLTEQTPGMPEPVAAWGLSPSGPELVVLLVPGFEGVALQTYLVEQASTRRIEDMELYLYQCAF